MEYQIYGNKNSNKNLSGNSYPKSESINTASIKKSKYIQREKKREREREKQQASWKISLFETLKIE